MSETEWAAVAAVAGVAAAVAAVAGVLLTWRWRRKDLAAAASEQATRAAADAVARWTLSWESKSAVRLRNLGPSDATDVVADSGADGQSNGWPADIGTVHAGAEADLIVPPQRLGQGYTQVTVEWVDGRPGVQRKTFTVRNRPVS